MMKGVRKDTLFSLSYLKSSPGLSSGHNFVWHMPINISHLRSGDPQVFPLTKFLQNKFGSLYKCITFVF